MVALSIIDVLKQYGPFGLIALMMYYFFYQYLPKQGAAIEAIVDKHNKNIESVVDKFKQESEARFSENKEMYEDLHGANKEIISSMTASNEKIIADMTKSNERIVGQAASIMNMTQEHSKAMVEAIALQSKDFSSSMGNRLDTLLEHTTTILSHISPKNPSQ